MTRQIEKRLLNEFLLERYREKPQWKNVRLGPFPDNETAKEFGVIRRWADAIIKVGGELIIIEAKFSPEFGGLGQLDAYSELLSRTPEFQEFKGFPVRLIYLTTREDADVSVAATGKGIEYIVFRPDWVDAEEKRRKRVPPLK